MKIRWSYVLAGGVLLTLAGLLVREVVANQGVDEGLYDFAVPDTAAVTRIVIWDKSPDTRHVRAKRCANGWSMANISFDRMPSK